ncbi:hypothetical protein [Microbulbifer sp. ZKSA002]|uniref:hypothetical protein n=1 Tax=Microbulbifer sp. ZKSA002 TaxID=3243388 RepID=UPI00403A6937
MAPPTVEYEQVVKKDGADGSRVVFSEDDSAKKSGDFKTVELEMVKYDPTLNFDLQEYIENPYDVDSTYELYKARSYCRKGSNLASPNLCQEIGRHSLPSEFESLTSAADQGHVKAQLEFSNFIPPNYEDLSQEEIDSLRNTRIEYLESAWASGSLEALHELSATYFYGLGVEQDLLKSYFYAKTAEIVYSSLNGAVPSSYVNENTKMVNHLEAVLYPYQREPVLREVYSQNNKNCCILFSS